MAYIQLTQGKRAIVDEEDFEKLSQYSWVYHSKGYAHTTVRLKSGRRTTVKMHRMILNAPKGIQVDHENLDGLDNRKSNLRLATQSQNMMNRKVQKNNKSGYKGVNFRGFTYRARIQVEGKLIRLGNFKTAVEAARAYDTKAKESFGEFANLNFKES